jgi:hypothetical protein
MELGSSGSLRAHLESVEEQAGITDPLLEEIRAMPAAGEQLWSIFEDLSSTRPTSGFGVSPISYAEIHAWCVVNHARLDAWEVDGLRRIDRAFMHAVAEAMRSK